MQYYTTAPRNTTLSQEHLNAAQEDERGELEKELGPDVLNDLVGAPQNA